MGYRRGNDRGVVGPHAPHFFIYDVVRCVSLSFRPLVIEPPYARGRAYVW